MLVPRRRRRQALLFIAAGALVLSTAGIAAAAPPDPIPDVLGGPVAAAAIDTVCTGTPAGATFTLTADCATTATLSIPNGVTLNGGGFTITADDPVGGNFVGPVVTNAGTSATVTNLTVQGPTDGFATQCHAGDQRLMGILFTDANGAISNVRVLNITQNDGCQEGIGIRVNALAGTPRTVTITGATVTGFQKGGFVASGLATVNVSGSTFGPADNINTSDPGLIAQNAVQFGVGGAGGTFTGNTVVGTGFGGATSASTAVLVFLGSNLAVTGNTITGAGTDLGVSINQSSNITVERNLIERTSVTPPDASGIGVEVDAASQSTTALICNTFAGWTTITAGSSQVPCITTTTVPGGTVGTAYSTQLAATMSNPPGTWALAAGSTLPPGLTLAPDGTISGTPTTAGTFTFSATVTDALGTTTTGQFTITIAAPAPAPAPAPTTPPSSAAPAVIAVTGPASTATMLAIAAILIIGGNALIVSARSRQRWRHLRR